MFLVAIHLETFSRAFIRLGGKPKSALGNSFFPKTVLPNIAGELDTVIRYITSWTPVRGDVIFDYPIRKFHNIDYLPTELSNDKIIRRNYAKNFFVAE